MRRTLIVSGLLLIPGCAPGPAVLLPGPAADQTSAITGREIASLPRTDVYWLIRHSRPLWLQTRGPVAPTMDGGIRVYVDGMELGGLEQLRGLPLDGLARVEYLDAREATLRFGVGHPHGAIEVVYGARPRGG
ncbi:MAG: hypothetical protein GWM90_04645 [Gemmatimonadetes bacterium]|nr:hypothetical protein [Gemmatimonadota bacterium]NIR35446.1 hypothetical protein [Actinomycetota bacterium]NIU73125.1 hypothetical protein [Gammaproteobacteria bacterium]NIQ52981.1 hypothetical protein [Gemmatimonadota bacterium]NIX43430.1 hypothetical protein [Gemmatimonadota bacterium]